MTTTTLPQIPFLEWAAAKALAARRHLQLAAYEARAALPFSRRSMLDRFLKVPPDRLFDPVELAAGHELLTCLREAIPQVGGAPVVRHTEEGERYTVGGTEAGRRIQTAAHHLSELLERAWQVSDRLVAETALAAQREAICRDRRSCVTPDGGSLSSPSTPMKIIDC